MATFIKLTTTDRDDFWINPRLIVAFSRVGSATQIVTVIDAPAPVVGHKLKVTETPEQILALIAAANPPSGA